MPQYELNLRDYLQIIQKRKFIIIGVFLFVLVFTIIYSNSQTPIYRVSATVKVSERKTIAGLLTEWFTWTGGDPIASQAKIIKSYTVMERVVKELGLVKPDASPHVLSSVVTGLQGSVSTEVMGETNVINIAVIGTNPERITKIANKIIEVYIDENLKEKNKQARTVREFIEGQLKEIKTKLAASEEALGEFKKSGEALGIAIPLQNKLADLQTEKAKLLRMYTEEHPDIVRLNEEISLMEERVKLLPDKELQYARLTRETEINEKLYRNLQEKFEEARIAEIEKVPDATLVNPAITPRAPVSPNKMLNGLLGIVIGLVLGLTLGFTVENMDTSIGTIEDVENILKIPAMGVIPYLKVEGEKRTLWQRILPLPYKGEEKISRLRSQLIIHYSMRSPEMEAYRILRTNLQHEVLKGEKGKIVLFSSSSPEEGKSINISNLAIAFAQGGFKTLLIDADMRRSIIHKIFGFKNKEPGLCDVLRGTVSFEDAVRTIADTMMGEIGFDAALKVPGLDYLSILTSGSLPTASSEMLSLPQTTALLERLRGEFNIVLLDSPPILAVADPLVLATKVDSVILIYRVGRTATKILLRAKEQFQEAGAKVQGVVLNNISQEVELRYNYPYHYKYYRKYYGEKEKEKEKTKT